MPEELNKNYWTIRYKEAQTGWDIGYASTPLVHYINTSVQKSERILIPGAGNAYEAEYLFNKGYSNVFVLDISAQPLKNFSKRCPKFPSKQLIHSNFFEHNGAYDLILEQTFFCALNPELRNKYNLKMQDLLADGGKLVGLLFNFPLSTEGPPFGGSLEHYKCVFTEWTSLKIKPCYNSIIPRQDKEFFLIAKK